MAQLDDDPLYDPPPPERVLSPPRPAYRVPLGLPQRDEGRRAGAVVSVLIHALIIALLLVPLLMPGPVLARIEQGAGGAGPAGGGGGGNQGTGGMRESLRFVRVAPEPVPTPKSLPPVPPPVKPKVEPPKPVITPPPTPAPQEHAAIAPPQTVIAAALPGANGGSGRDGTAGAGPGSGGGVGSGVGPGRGSATGPGTGGGTQTNYSPTVLNLTLPPLPAPASVRGWKMIANFDVDSTGRVLDFKVNESPDGSFNRQLANILRTYKFRPGTRPDGTPIRMIAQLSFDF